MINRLPVRPDHVDLRKRHTPALASFHRGSSKLLAQQEIQLTDLRRGCWRAIRDPEYRRPHARGERRMMMRLELDGNSRRSARDAHERNVDPVRRRSRHHSYHSHHALLISTGAGARTVGSAPQWALADSGPRHAALRAPTRRSL